jgi:hypothetical protein
VPPWGIEAPIWNASEDFPTAGSRFCAESVPIASRVLA